MLGRLNASARALLIALDVLACTVWLALLYPFNLADKPTGRQTVSGYVGKAALYGQKWALLPERCIDAVMGEGHCLRSYQRGQG